MLTAGGKWPYSCTVRGALFPSKGLAVSTTFNTNATIASPRKIHRDFMQNVKWAVICHRDFGLFLAVYVTVAVLSVGSTHN